MFDSRLSAGATEKLPGWDKQHAKKGSIWSYDMKGHAKKCVERYCESVNKKAEQLCKVSTLCLDDHHIKKEELESVGELSEVCSQIVLKCLHFARIGRPDILWSVNKLARSATKWAQACDRRVARLSSYIHRTRDYHQYCHVGNASLLSNCCKNCRFCCTLSQKNGDELRACSKTQILRARSQHRVEFCAYLEVAQLFL